MNKRCNLQQIRCRKDENCGKVIEVVILAKTCREDDGKRNSL
jgi:hypothetical protein